MRAADSPERFFAALVLTGGAGGSGGGDSGGAGGSGVRDTVGTKTDAGGLSVVKCRSMQIQYRADFMQICG